MSFIQGETLEEYLNKAKGGRLPVEEVIQIGIQLCRVLDYLHMQQPPVIFRDLKPSNIMRATDGHLYLIDFGIARHFKPGQAKDTAAYGSMGYASPEQYGKAQTTPRSDMYSLGAVLYQLLSGYDPSTTPFRFPPLQSQIPTIPSELVALIAKMLELDEDKRPTSMLTVKQRLESITAPASNSIGPIQYVRPAPLAPTQFAAARVAPKPAASLSSSAPSKVWSFGRRQLKVSTIGAGLCAVVYYGVLFLLNSGGVGRLLGSLTNIEIFIGLILVPPLFFGAVFGPWVGLVSTGIGSFFADFVANLTIYHESIAWKADLPIAFLAFFAGLALLKTQGHYDKPGNIFIATLVGCSGVAIAQGLEWLLYGFVFSYGLLRIIPCLILLPVLLIIYNAAARQRSHP